ncbi:MAG: hypothetical protein H7X93_04515 [Sphingomonadaceae bacterium]|nr:hypothetical protein [Sphingomonadaceae bacterium]
MAIAAAAAAMLSIPSAAAQDETEDWQRAVPVGEPVSCVPLRQIRSTEVHDDRTIDFRMTGGRTYRNTLPHDCPGLGFDEAFSYRTSLSQLCSVDIITVLRQPISSAIQGPSCGLGEFQPIETAER